MMPDKVYVTSMKTSEKQDAFVGLAYGLDKLLIDKTEYIRKEALLEWLESRIKDLSNGGFVNGLTTLAYKDVVEHINEM